MRALKTSLTILLLTAPMHGPAFASVEDAGAAQAVQELLWTSGTPVSRDGARLDFFYRDRAYEPVWRRDGAWSPQARVAIRVLGGAEQHGLDPADYEPRALAQALDTTPADEPRAMASTEIRLTAAVIRYLDHLHNGRIAPETVDWKIRYEPRGPGFLLADALQSPRFETALAEPPRSSAYRALAAAQSRYRDLADGEWPRLPDGRKLTRGDEGQAVAILRRQLALLGDLGEDAAAPLVQSHRQDGGSDAGTRAAHMIPASAVGQWREQGEARPPARSGRRDRTHPASTRFDGELEAAVRRFQERHGLAVDGRVGPDTRAALNVSPAQRLRQIRLNMERLRWMPPDLGQRYVFVNIPAYQLTAVENGQVALRMPVVVGEPKWPTPVLSDEIVDLKFAPTWTVPPNILRKEMLSQIRRDPGYIERKGLRVYRNGREYSPWEIDWSSVSNGSGYVLRQEPGPRNALGQIRFSLTNPYDIYLHDTPSTQGFRKVNRALSHGCVRVADPEGLGMFVLSGDPSWDRARLVRSMNSTRTNFHHLDYRVPVYLAYLTAWTDESGIMQFRDDVYNRDETLAAALQRRQGPGQSAS